jgi:hypothetical protein
MSRLKGGKGKKMSFKGRLILINSVITVTATYFLTTVLRTIILLV